MTAFVCEHRCEVLLTRQCQLGLPNSGVLIFRVEMLFDVFGYLSLNLILRKSLSGHPKSLLNHISLYFDYLPLSGAGGPSLFIIIHLNKSYNLS